MRRHSDRPSLVWFESLIAAFRIDMGERYPKARLIGTDLSPIQPEYVPDNVRFEIDDLESEWLFKPNRFDLIHSRYMIGAVANWKRMIAQAFGYVQGQPRVDLLSLTGGRHCRPGGYLEIQELDVHTMRSDDGTDAAAHNLKEYGRLLREAMRKYKKPMPGHRDFKPLLEEAGFIDVEEHFKKMPLNGWSGDDTLKEVGNGQCAHYDEHLLGMSIGFFTRALNWDEGEVQVLLARVRTELKNPKIHCYQILYVPYSPTRTTRFSG